MALSDYLKRGQIGPSHKNDFYQYQRGEQWVTSKWPKKRGKPKSAAQAASQAFFSEICKAIKLTAPPIQHYHRENAKGTPMLPRDSLMAALYGNGPIIRFYNGKVLRPMANKLLASSMLDAIAWEPGSILMRHDDLWEPLLPGPAGYVLASRGPGLTLEWVPSGGGGAGTGQWWFPGNPTSNATKYRTFGTSMWPLINFQVNTVLFTTVHAGTFALKAQVWLMEGDDLVTLLDETPVSTLAVAAGHHWSMSFEDPPLLEQGLKYCLVLTGEDTSDHGGWANSYTAGADVNRPFDRQPYRFTSNSVPASSLTISPVTGGTQYSGLHWSA